jgi:predicted DNA binding CopG/RHH family protein
VLDIGGKERKYMSNTINYTDAPIDIEQSLDNATIISDFLPSPAELVSRGEKEKITISVDKRSLDLFKKYAKKHNTKYQPMINGVLSSYADKFLNR